MCWTAAVALAEGASRWKTASAVVAEIEEPMLAATAADPVAGLKRTRKTTTRLSDKLRDLDIDVPQNGGPAARRHALPASGQTHRGSPVDRLEPVACSASAPPS
jgi:hypothetical protein